MFEILPVAEADIEQVLSYTARTFGLHQYDRYAALIEDALGALADDSEAGKRRLDIHPEAWSLHIAQPGRDASHLFLYRIDSSRVAVIYGLFHQVMNLPKHWVTRTAEHRDEESEPP